MIGCACVCVRAHRTVCTHRHTHQVRMFFVSSSGRERCRPMVTWRQGKSAKLNSGQPDKACDIHDNCPRVLDHMR